MPFRFRSFQSRIVFFVLGLLSIVQIVVFVTIDAANTRHARTQIDLALSEGVRSFRRAIETRTGQLTESVRILAGDFAFKSAIATGDLPTIGSVLQNHGTRIAADTMLLVSLESELIAASGDAVPDELPPALAGLVLAAGQRGRSATALELRGVPYQMIVLPVLAPLPVAWIAAGFRADERLARDLQQVTKLEISFTSAASSANRKVLASTLPRELHRELAASAAILHGQEGMASLPLAGDEYLSRVVPLGGQAAEVDVVLQRSLAKELAPFQELRISVLLLSCGGLVLSFFGTFFLARSVTRPVRALAEAARSVERGDFATTVEVRQQDELGELAKAFNHMVRGLAERDRVRNLLGKVVSPAVAEKLLSRKVKLGGEVREVTVMFSDLRGFTTFSEHRAPAEIVAVLNAYFTRMSAVIEANNGVVDKYQGDGIMALFGAPLSHADDAGNALQASIEMFAALEELNAELRRKGLQGLDMGIGINTAEVVAGNFGSPQRLNYTVVGDGVNLAARLEGLTKRPGIGARIIASAATIERSRRSFEVRALGETEVRGRTEPVALFAVLGAAKDAGGATPPAAAQPPARLRVVSDG